VIPELAIPRRRIYRRHTRLTPSSSLRCLEALRHSLDNMRLGIIVPSSNTAVEPLVFSLLHSLNDPSITVHFSRFSVTSLSLTSEAVSQFQFPPILAAARLLADARVDIIGWNGTSGGWLGFENDERLCEAIQKETGIRATTSVLALNKILQLADVRKLGLVTPYTDDIQNAICENYKRIGVLIDKACERHLGLTDNARIAEIDERVLDDAVVAVAGEDINAITTFCTNLKAAQRVNYWETTIQIPVFDTVTVVVWDMLRLLGYDTARVKGWGKMFSFK
jgi:maleate isomerase